jgi:tetraacyldisaccharide 4'-kinase
LLKSFRYLLLPISFIYGMLVWIRNKLYDLKVLKSAQFNFPLICIGNLAIGGTGKTPMTEWVVTRLKNDFQLAILSRGYKRRTKGFAIANEHTSAIEIGDEPMQFHLKFPDITVAVGEERLVAIPQILYQRPEVQAIIMDDAFQHRAVHAGLNILLTEYQNLYTRDLMLPAGDLRDIKSSSGRANVIIVTKCPETLSREQRKRIELELRPAPAQTCFFTTIKYGLPYHLFSRVVKPITQETEILLVCGIANPKHLKTYLTTQTKSYEMIRYADHHIFKINDLAEIKQHFDRMSGSNKMIITTEKDAVRLHKFKSELEHYPIFVLPITHEFLFEETNTFLDLLIDFIKSHKRPDLLQQNNY